MEFVRQSHDIIQYDENAEKLIEFAGRTCTKSTHKIDVNTHEKIVKSLVDMEHHAMIEFAHMTVLFECDRSTTHELVRHRLCSFAQESQRFVKYNGHTRFILPPWISDDFLGQWTESCVTDISDDVPDDVHTYLKSCSDTEQIYKQLLDMGWKPEQARKRLTNDVATTILVKANFREWRHIFNLRCKGSTGRPDPSIHDLMMPLYQQMKLSYPDIFK